MKRDHRRREDQREAERMLRRLADYHGTARPQRRTGLPFTARTGKMANGHWASRHHLDRTQQ